MTLFCGLLQAIVALGTNNFLTSPIISIEQLVMDGALLFVSAAIVSSLPVDYYLSQGISRMKPWVRFWFLLIPIAIVFGCVWMYTICYGKTPEQINIQYVANFEGAIFMATFLYTFVVKLDAFK